MSVRLDAYLDLERTMRALDDVNDPIADALRDALDPIWYGLTDEERAFLNRRIIAQGVVYGVRLPVMSEFFVEVPATAPPTAAPIAPVLIADWKVAA